MDQKQLPGAIILAAFIIGGAILIKDTTVPPQPANPVAISPDVSKIRSVDSNEHILGNPNAEVIIVEYSDTECPFCKRFHATMHQVISANNGKVAWVYRHYPIPQLHQKAQREAEATECAWEQGGNDAFWKYTDEIYVRTNSNDSLADSELPKIAGYIGLNVEAFTSCLNSGKHEAKVQNDVNNGNTIGVRGTPSSYILKKGKIFPFIDQQDRQTDNIPGAQPFDIVNKNIERALKN